MGSAECPSELIWMGGVHQVQYETEKRIKLYAIFISGMLPKKN